MGPHEQWMWITHCDVPRLVRVTRHGSSWYFETSTGIRRVFIGEDAFGTLEEAKARARELIAANIEAMKQRMERIEAVVDDGCVVIE